MTTSPTTKGFLLEVCAGDLRSVANAITGGADRIELCAALSEGGITPSAGMVASAMRLSQTPVRVMIRPRSGDFTYSQIEIEQMEYDIQQFVSMGVDGFVIGALAMDSCVDVTAMERLVDGMGEKPWTFHRAFDFCPDPYQALETIIALGADAVLTSGQADSAMEGADLLKDLVNQAAGRITIMAGAGINPQNISRLHIASGCRAFHLSARSTLQNQIPLHHAARINAGEIIPDHLCRVTDAEIIKYARKALIHSLV